MHRIPSIEIIALSTLIFFAFALCLLPSLSIAVTPPIDVREIVERVDKLYRSDSSYARIEMQIVTSHWKRTLALEAWTKGMDKTFILINSPKKEKGVATLRIGDEMWNYLPKVSKVMKIPPSMMMGSWMGSDFTNDDLVHEFSMLEDYHHELITPEEAQPDLLYIQLIPKEDLPIVWGKVIAAIRKSDYIPVWEKFYDEKGRLMRTLELKNIKQLGGRWIPSAMEMAPQNKEGHKTTVEYLDAKFDSKMDDSIFTLRNLRKRR